MDRSDQLKTLSNVLENGRVSEIMEDIGSLLLQRAIASKDRKDWRGFHFWDTLAIHAGTLSTLAHAAEKDYSEGRSAGFPSLG